MDKGCRPGVEPPLSKSYMDSLTASLENKSYLLPWGPQMKLYENRLSLI